MPWSRSASIGACTRSPGQAVPDRPVRGKTEATPTYADDYRGWPLSPVDETHAVYGTFLNPTTLWPSGMPGPRVGYHKAIDILVNDADGPQPVFAIEGGRVREAKLTWQTTPLAERVRCGVVGAGHFRYAHVVPEVDVGETIVAGQRIGRTCPGWWHVHLEEWATLAGRRTALNPLRPGGKLAPLADTGRPAIQAMRLYRKSDETNPSPQVVPRESVRGVVVPVALAMDKFPVREWPGAPIVPLHVYRASIELKRGETVIEQRTLFQIDAAPGPTWQHFFRPLTRRSAPIAVCVVRKPQDCAGRYWLRLSEQGLDTNGLANGWHTLALTAEDTVGRSATRTLRFRVAN
jgi:hypothetical protein